MGEELTGGAYAAQVRRQVERWEDALAEHAAGHAAREERLRARIAELEAEVLRLRGLDVPPRSRVEMVFARAAACALSDAPCS